MNDFARGAGDGYLRVRDLRVVFAVSRGVLFRRTVGEVRAVDDVSFSLHRGHTLGIVGESGCGKTTILRSILRMVPLQGGHVFVDGEDVHRLSGKRLKGYRRKVQVVLQDPYSSLDLRMRVGAIISEPIDPSRIRAAVKGTRERVGELLELVGLDRAAVDRYPHQFSGGQRQRIAIARALAPSPQLLLLDEPTSALDMSIRAQVINLLQDLQRKLGLTYVVISHDLGAIAYMSTDIAVMYLGRIVEAGRSDTVYGTPLHPYTQLLLSSSDLGGSAEPRDLLRAGEMPSAMAVPPGCRFHPRCPLREKLGDPKECETDEPELRQLSTGHLVACHFASLPARSGSEL